MKIATWFVMGAVTLALAVVALVGVLPSAETRQVGPVAPETAVTTPDGTSPAAGTYAAVAGSTSERVPPSEPESKVAVVSATVVRVVDGDTAVFRLRDGAEEKVRFIGVDTPESTNSIEVYGKEASAYTARALPVGAAVFLERDVEERDRYGRLLAYVWLENPGVPAESRIRERMLNARLALDGYAQQMTIQPNSRYADYFRTFVAEARTAERGLWNPALLAAAAIKPAPALAKVAPSAQPAGGYIGNGRSKKFHYPQCSSVGEMSASNKVALKSREQAIAQGYVPCKRCDP